MIHQCHLRYIFYQSLAVVCSFQKKNSISPVKFVATINELFSVLSAVSMVEVDSGSSISSFCFQNTRDSFDLSISGNRLWVSFFNRIFNTLFDNHFESPYGAAFIVDSKNDKVVRIESRKEGCETVVYIGTTYNFGGAYYNTRMYLPCNLLKRPRQDITSLTE